MDAELVARYESEFSLNRYRKRKKNTKDDIKETIPDWEYIAQKEEFPKFCPSDMDRTEDMDILLTRWKNGEWSPQRVKHQAKRRGFAINFHKNDNLPADYITIIDLYLGITRRWYY